MFVSSENSRERPSDYFSMLISSGLALVRVAMLTEDERRVASINGLLLVRKISC